MQKISSYLYPNRIILTADLAGFTTEYTNVYQRQVKIYKGVPNVLEFDIKNADQKRIDLTTVSSISLNVMDASGKALPNSPYTVTPNAPITGICSISIPAADVATLENQYLTYSVTAVINSVPTLMYADSKFSATSTLELVGWATPHTRSNQIFDTFTGEIDFAGNVQNHSSAVPAKFYEAVPTANLTFAVIISTGFLGKVYLESTTDMTVSVNSWLNAAQTIIFDNTSTNIPTTAQSTVTVTVPVSNYNYFRLTYGWPLTSSIYSNMDIYGGYGATNGPGKVVSFTVS